MIRSLFSFSPVLPTSVNQSQLGPVRLHLSLPFKGREYGLIQRWIAAQLLSTPLMFVDWT